MNLQSSFLSALNKFNVTHSIQERKSLSGAEDEEMAEKLNDSKSTNSKLKNTTAASKAAMSLVDAIEGKKNSKTNYRKKVTE